MSSPAHQVPPQFQNRYCLYESDAPPAPSEEPTLQVATTTEVAPSTLPEWRPPAMLDDAGKARAQIDQHARKLGSDELRVLEMVAARLVMGRQQYGELRLDQDARDWEQEAGEEALDLAVYLSALMLRPKR